MQSNRRALILTLGMYLTISRLQLSVMGQHTGESKGLKRNNNALFLWLWGAKESGSLLNLCMITSWVDDEKMSVQIAHLAPMSKLFPPFHCRGSQSSLTERPSFRCWNTSITLSWKKQYFNPDTRKMETGVKSLSDRPGWPSTSTIGDMHSSWQVFILHIAFRSCGGYRGGQTLVFGSTST